MTIYSIYKITNLSNGKAYIGWTSRDPFLRFKEHQRTRKPKHQQRSAISCAIEKHGVDNFTFEVLYQTKDQSHSKDVETHFIAEGHCMTSEWGYNLDLGGTGHKRTPETIEKHRQAIKGRRQSDDHIKKRLANWVNPSQGRTGENAIRYGKKLSEESIAKMKATKALKPRMSDEEKRLAKIDYSRRYREKRNNNS
jgi:group I intron endonuclease